MTKRTTSRSRKRSTSSRRRSSSRKRGSSKRSKSKRKQSQPLITLSKDQKLDILGGVLIFVALLTILSLLSAQQGTLTELWISFLSNLFGWGMYIVPIFIGAVGLWLILRRFGDRIPWPQPEQVVGIVLAFFVALTTLHLLLRFIYPQVDFYALVDSGKGGGLVGAALLDLGLNALGIAGVIITLVLAWLIVITFIAGISPADALRLLVQRSIAQPGEEMTSAVQMPLPEESVAVTGPPPVESSPSASATSAKKSRQRSKNRQDEDIEINVSSRSSNGAVEITIPPVGSQVWRLPAFEDILEEGSEQYYSADLIRKQVRIIEDTLESLGAPAKMREINQGPVVTQFGVEPQMITLRSGKQTKVKVSKIANLADDLALALSAKSIRIQAPIPGKGLVGIEVPNEEPALVSLRDSMESERFAKLKGRLRLGLGQDVSGQAVAADLRTMPHLLIAGSTGSGKSVCVNAIIAALLLQNSPDTLRLLLVDPKRVELTQYNGIPHLLSPVIVDVERVVPALRWVMREMDSRYRRFAQVGARNIDDYNRRVEKMQSESQIPYVVVLVDELADMMMQAPEETERVVCRLAQMSRATGIHLVIATQRPSVDVVTGLIKANFPARIAFAVASSIDSRVIIDMPGAERLLGRGDMLFMPPDVGQPLRLQGAFVSDRELNRLIDYWRHAVEPGSAPEHVIPQPASPSARDASQPTLFPDFEDTTTAQFEDALLPSAVEIFLTENRASISLLQRRLRIGYTRSARLVDTLTDMGIVTVETKGQFRGVNRAVAEAFLKSLRSEENAANTL